MIQQELFSVISKVYSSGFNLNRTYVAPNIPDRKLPGALRGIVSSHVKAQDIILVADDTAFGGADDGIVLTSDALYYHEFASDPIAIRFSELERISTVQRLGLMTRIKFVFKSGGDLVMPGFVNALSDYDKFASYLQRILQAYKEVHSRPQAQPRPQFAQAPKPSRQPREFIDAQVEDVVDAAQDQDADEEVFEYKAKPSSHFKAPVPTSRPRKAVPVNLSKPQLPAGFTPDLYVLLTKEYERCFKYSFSIPNIPERKLNGAIVGLAENQVDPDEVVLVCDDTLFGGADNGLLFTRHTMYYSVLLHDANEIELQDIRSVEVKQQDNDQNVVVTLNSGRHITLPDFAIVIKDTLLFAQWLQSVAEMTRYEAAVAQASGSDPSQKIMVKSLEQMPSEVQFVYLQIISNFLLSDDGKVDAKEACLFYSLMARLNLNAQQRFKLRIYQSTPSEYIDTQCLVEQLFEYIDRLRRQDIVTSLLKDMINIYLQSHSEQGFYSGKAQYTDEAYLKSPFIVKFARDNRISKEQMRVIQSAIEADSRLFDDNLDDAGLTSALSNVAAAAGSVGLPIAAVYFSGSVIGLSASGITSGLAALGLGGLFGFSSMVTGIGAVILIGLGVNKGIKVLTGQDERDKRARKQAMLFAVNRNLTKSINMLVEDINTFTQELLRQVERINNLEMELADKEEQINDLFEQIQELSVFSTGSHLLIEDAQTVETKAFTQSIPLELNLERLMAITDEPTKQIFRDEILKLYNKQRRNGEDVYRLCDDLTADEAKFLSEALIQLDYFSVSGLAKSGIASIKSMFN